MDRGKHGVTRAAINRDPLDPGHFLLTMGFASIEAAAAFRDLPAFRCVWDASGAGSSWVLEDADTTSTGG